MAITRSTTIDKGCFGGVTTDKTLQYSGDAVTKKTQLLIALILLCVVDAVVPFFPVLGLVLIYVVLEKPVVPHNWYGEEPALWRMAREIREIMGRAGQGRCTPVGDRFGAKVRGVESGLRRYTSR